MTIARKEGVTLRHARSDDMPRVDELTIACYAPIHRSYVQMLGEECYRAVRHDPQLTWEERKTGQVHRLFRDHPEWVWVLEKEGNVIGFVTFMLFADQNYGHIDNNEWLRSMLGRDGEGSCINMFWSILEVRT